MKIMEMYCYDNLEFEFKWLLYQNDSLSKNYLNKFNTLTG